VRRAGETRPAARSPSSRPRRPPPGAPSASQTRAGRLRRTLQMPPLPRTVRRPRFLSAPIQRLGRHAIATVGLRVAAATLGQLRPFGRPRTPFTNVSSASAILPISRNRFVGPPSRHLVSGAGTSCGTREPTNPDAPLVQRCGTRIVSHAASSRTHGSRSWDRRPCGSATARRSSRRRRRRRSPRRVTLGEACVDCAARHGATGSVRCNSGRRSGGSLGRLSAKRVSPPVSATMDAHSSAAACDREGVPRGVGIVQPGRPVVKAPQARGPHRRLDARQLASTSGPIRMQLTRPRRAATARRSRAGAPQCRGPSRIAPNPARYASRGSAAP